MSTLHQRLRSQSKAQREFVEHLCALRNDLNMHVPVRFLELRVRLLEELIEKTGGCLLTQDFRVALADAKKQIALRAEQRRRANSSGSLHLVREQ